MKASEILDYVLETFPETITINDVKDKSYWDLCFREIKDAGERAELEIQFWTGSNKSVWFYIYYQGEDNGGNLPIMSCGENVDDFSKEDIDLVKQQILLTYN